MAATRTAHKGRTGKGKKQDSYQVVTDLIIGALEQGVVPWHRPWKNVGGAGIPRSLSSRKPYRGVNVWTLAVTAMLQGYESPWWGTYKQIGERGGQVRKGEKGTPVVFFRPIPIEEEVNGKKQKRTILLLKHFVVFNADQADGVKAPKLPTTEGATLLDHEPVELCERIAYDYLWRGPKLSHGGDWAFYRPSTDAVRMPARAQFETVEHYYGTLFHELAHSTGHESRLARESLVQPAPFGSPDYSKEELVAEMTAAFLCAEGGIDVNVPHRAAYIDNWLKALKDDRKLVVSAGAAAQTAADLVLGREPESSGEEAQ